MFYTDWYEHDYQKDHDAVNVMKELRKLPKLIENDTHDKRPNNSDIGVMLDGLRKVYDNHHSTYYGIGIAVENILKKLCVVARVNSQYDKALHENIPEYLKLSSLVCGEDSETFAKIKEYCEAKNNKSITVDNSRIGFEAAHDLMNILNVKNLTAGGWNTEYTLYAIRGILTSPGGMSTFGDSALELCEMLSNYDFDAVNKKLNMHNEDIIIQLIYELLIILLEGNIYMTNRIRRIKTRLDETNHIPKLSEHAIHSGKVYSDLARKNVDLEQKLIISQSAIQMKQMLKERK